MFGLKFGKLTAESCVGKNSSNQFLWECICDCGEKTIATAHSLLSGNVTSCGCIKSKGENKIKQILKDFGINFSTEYSFPDLIDKAPLRFDFCLKDKKDNIICLIEYQGIQHFNTNNKWYSETLKRHDQMKKEYCLKNNIKLVEISYKDFDKIDKNYLMEKIKT